MLVQEFKELFYVPSNFAFQFAFFSEPLYEIDRSVFNILLNAKEMKARLNTFLKYRKQIQISEF